jgi:hypothetical protein
VGRAVFISIREKGMPQGFPEPCEIRFHIYKFNGYLLVGLLYHFIKFRVDFCMNCAKFDVKLQEIGKKQGKNALNQIKTAIFESFTSKKALFRQEAKKNVR